MHGFMPAWPLFALLLFVTAADGEWGTSSRPGFADDPSERESPLHRFERSEVTLPLPAPIAVEATAAIRAQWVQVSHRLTRPHGEPVELCASNCATLERFTLVLPAVDRITTFEIHLQHGGSSTGWPTLYTVPIRIYPSNLLAPVKNWAHHNTLVVRDREGKLHRFLESEDIPFVTRMFPSTGRRPVVQLLTGDEERPRERREQKPRRTVVFTENVSDLPKILVREQPPHRHIRVEMMLLDRLTDPRAQLVLLETFRMSLNTEGM